MRYSNKAMITVNIEIDPGQFGSERNPLIGLVEKQDPDHKHKEHHELEPFEINFLHPVPRHGRKSKLGDPLEQTRPSKKGDHHPPVSRPDIVRDDIEQTNDNGEY